MKNKKEDEEELTILSPIRGLARSIIGLSLGATIIGFSFARSIIGTTVNSGLAIMGAFASATVFTAHLGNFVRVQTIKLFNKETEANADFTKEIFNKTVNFTNERLKAAFSSFYRVFSGERDEEIKANIASLVKTKQISSDSSNSHNEQQKIEQLIKDIPNTKDTIITAAQLILGMSKEERKTANTKRKKNNIPHSNRL